MCACKAISVYNKRGMEAFNQGRNAEAVQELIEAVRLAGSIGTPMHQAKIRNNLALVLQAAGDKAQARQELQAALHTVEAKIGRENKLYCAMARNLSALGEITSQRSV